MTACRERVGATEYAEYARTVRVWRRIVSGAVTRVRQSGNHCGEAAMGRTSNTLR